MNGLAWSYAVVAAVVAGCSAPTPAANARRQTPRAMIPPVATATVDATAERERLNVSLLFPSEDGDTLVAFAGPRSAGEPVLHCDARLSTLKARCFEAPPDAEVRTVSPRGAYVVIAHRNRVVLREALTGKRVVDQASRPIAHAAVSPNEAWAAVVDDRGDLTVWSTADGTKVFERKAGAPSQGGGPSTKRRGRVVWTAPQRLVVADGGVPVVLWKNDATSASWSPAASYVEPVGFRRLADRRNGGG